MRPSYKAPKNLSIRKSIHPGGTSSRTGRKATMCVSLVLSSLHYYAQGKKKENGRKDIVEVLFSLQTQFNSIQRYEIEKKLNGK